MNGPLGTRLLLGGAVQCLAFGTANNCTIISANLSTKFKARAPFPVPMDREVKQKEDCPAAWVPFFPTCPPLPRHHLHQHTYQFLLLSHWLTQMQVIFLLQNWQGTLQRYKSRQKGSVFARVACNLRKERGCAELKTHGLESPHAFFFSWIPLSPSVRITVVFLVAEPTQEIKYFVFL